MPTIPDTAIDVAEVAIRHSHPDGSARDAAIAALQAALPHLLADYRERLVRADTELKTTAGGYETGSERWRSLHDKAAGVRLSVSFLDETLRG